MWQQLLEGIQKKDFKALSRSISLVENEVEGYMGFLQQLVSAGVPVIGITGPPGAGKSTLTDALIQELIKENKTIGVLCIDPSSPFNLGALLGDRIRMSNWYTHPKVFIRSLATRGALGGLHPQVIEIMTLMQASGFDSIIVETVGVGQSEVEIAGLADTTVVVVVPEAGDEVQTMKAGLMEIADIFVVNKSDRPEADLFVKNLRMMLAPSFTRKHTDVPVLKTVASEQKGIKELVKVISGQQKHLTEMPDKKSWLMTEKAFKLIQKKRMSDVNKESLRDSINREAKQSGFNLFTFVEENY